MLQRLAGPLADAGLNVLGGIIGGRAGPIITTVGGAVLRELGGSTSEQAVRKIETPVPDPSPSGYIARASIEPGKTARKIARKFRARGSETRF